MKKKVVLAYSGGLDTSVAIRWIMDTYGADVIAVAVDIGEERDYEGIRQKALEVGAVESYVIDAKDEFWSDFLAKALKANAVYEGQYPLATALGRPLIAKATVEIAEKTGAHAVAHGCTGKGNDQVRFEVSYAALKPDLDVIAPAREWGMTREQEIQYAQERGIPVPVTVESPYSIDVNMWGRSVECGVLEHPDVEPPEDAFEWTVAPEDAPDEPQYLDIGFERGLPVTLNGQAMSGPELVAELNRVGGAHGVGRISMIENRLVGIKSRETYEAPAATILLEAHRDLEAFNLERDTLHYKRVVEEKYAELVYYGLWYSPLRRALDAFMDTTQENITGQVTVKLFKGSCVVASRKSELSLYDLDAATYGDTDTFDHTASKGFIDIFGLPIKVAAAVVRKTK